MYQQLLRKKHGWVYSAPPLSANYMLLPSCYNTIYLGITSPYTDHVRRQKEEQGSIERSITANFVGPVRWHSWKESSLHVHACQLSPHLRIDNHVAPAHTRKAGLLLASGKPPLLVPGPFPCTSVPMIMLAGPSRSAAISQIRLDVLAPAPCA